MKKKTTIYLDEDSHQWFIRMRAIVGLARPALIFNAVKLYAALLDEEKFSSLGIPSSETVRQSLIAYVDNEEPITLPQRFD